MSAMSILVAGFGGQGLLFAGKVLAYEGLLEDKNVSWLPTYGPEMRGGTANCSVIISDSLIGSPIIDSPDVLIAMNLPSLDKFEPTVAKGGRVYIDSSLIDRKARRDDTKVCYIPATKLAGDMGAAALANMVILGKMIKDTACVKYESIINALNKVVSARHKDLIELNLKALDVGYNYC